MGKTKKKRSRSPDSSSSDESEKKKRKLKKLKKKLKKEQRKSEKVLKKKLKEEKKKLKEEARRKSKIKTATSEISSSADIPLDLMERSKKMAPMTKEEWDKRQSIVRKVLDEESGRYRLIKGDGEVLEEIVSKGQHKQINKHATRSDGEFFQSQTIGKNHY